MPDSDPSCTRILVAEDDPVTAKLLTYRLRREPGFEVVHCDDGLDALDVLTKEHFHLAILDVQLPGLDGFAILRELRSRPDKTALRVIMLTSKDGEDDVVRGLHLGADDYVVKPFSPAELMARVTRLLSSGRSDSGG